MPKPFRQVHLETLREDGHFKTLDQIEREVIRLVLEECGGSVTEAARALRIGRSTLYRKLGTNGASAPIDSGRSAFFEQAR